MQKIFSETTKMADLVLGNSKLLLMFPRFGMDLGFGDHSIAEVCAMNNVSAPFFLMICNVYCNDDYTPSPEDIASVDLKALINYLLESHKYYLNERLPHIEEHLNHIIKACIPKSLNDDPSSVVIFVTHLRDLVVCVHSSLDNSNLG